jgi:hypothetical protein
MRGQMGLSSEETDVKITTRKTAKEGEIKDDL